MTSKKLTYASTGVDIDAGEQVVRRIGQMVQRTHGPRVLGKLGGFAGCLRLDYNEQLFRRNYKDPVLAACTDGVGSKVLLATELDILETVGLDCVAMNVNDLIVQGAEPLLFLDYIGIHRDEPATVARIVEGVAKGCRISRCALLGGETAALPDVYKPGDFDLAGFCVGVCELNKVIHATRVQAGDVILGLASSGIHSNGYSLVRAIVKKARLSLTKVYDQVQDPKARPLGQVLLTPTRIYVPSVLDVMRQYRVKQPISAMAHITGGGLPGNLPRSFPESLDAVIDTQSWQVPGLFRFLQQRADIDDAEMWRVFNMGVGYVMIVRPWFADSIVRKLKRAGEDAWVMGKMTSGSGQVRFK